MSKNLLSTKTFHIVKGMKICHPKMCFWNIDRKLVIKKLLKDSERTFDAPLPCQREFRWKDLFQEGNLSIFILAFWIKCGRQKDLCKNLFFWISRLPLFLGCLVGICLPRACFLLYQCIAYFPFEITDPCPPSLSSKMACKPHLLSASLGLLFPRTTKCILVKWTLQIFSC